MLCWPRARLPSRCFLMRLFIKLILPTLLAGVLVAGCGGSGTAVSSSDIAVVGKQHVTQAAFNALLDQQKQAAGTSFPKQGTAEYEAAKSKLVTGLVQQAERTDRATSDGINITDKQVDARLKTIKQQYFKG